MAMKESVYQRNLIMRIEQLFPGCVVIKNDPRLRQGVLDLLILFNDHWAMLEVKASEDSPLQPNQDYYIDMFDEMSYAALIYPENEVMVLNELQLAFGFARKACVS
jgi:hypothetical protein